MRFVEVHVSKHEIVSRGLHLRCPNCGAKSLFPEGSLRIHDECPSCGLDLNRGEGFFLGPMVVNYSIAVLGFAVPCLALWAGGVLPLNWAFGLAGAGCVFLPIVLYRASWSLWLMVYFWFLPERLPANGGARGMGAED